MKQQLYVEIPTETIGGRIVSSTFRDATEDEVIACKAEHKSGKCDHSVFYDEGGWMYDVRKCGVCHESIGLI